MKDKITVSTSINADIKKVWQYYTSPEHITKWNFADPSWYCPSAENDLKVGGKYRSRMEARDGSMGFDFEGTYDDIVPDQKIKYSLQDGRVVEVIMEPVGSQTNITVNFDAETENPMEAQQKGWQAILDNFKNYVELN
ncbi:MAG TPA: SRPBCC family protein [Saprospiraceae bacterium]|nr:SRPBCC family protein [Saprospiraceae bacterium]HQW56658.1 SRPBCC family protein [Saprospiraceae bacterium]